MKTVGIIAEYNPFHNGHAYQLQKAKEAAGADFAVIIMSPDFVQRGEPALVDKYSRAKMALASGADLVIELPVCYACGSAEYFAEGGISLLRQLGCVDALSFGCETDDPALFCKLADLLLQEPDKYRQKLREYQKQGMTFPKARETSLLDYLSQNRKARTSISKDSSFANLPVSDVSALLSSPNNILGLEYTKALKKQNSSISILPIRRQGSGYHSFDFNQEFCSASAIRAKLTVCTNVISALLRPGEASEISQPAVLSETFPDVFAELAPFLPETSLRILKEKALSSGFVTMEQFSSLLHYKLLSETATGFESYLDVSSDLSDRITRLLPEYDSFHSFVSLLKTRQLTEARIRRALLHILLNITGVNTEDYRLQGIIFYARVLGFRREAAPLLHAIKENASIPMITKLADAKNILSGPALRMLTQDIYTSRIYQLPYGSSHRKALRNEYTCSPVIF